VCCAAERFTNDEIDLKPEPSLESFGIKVPKGEAAADDDDDAAAAAAAAGGDEAAAKQQQQQQRSSSKGTKQKQKQAAANGAAAANGTAAAAAGAEGSSDDDEGPAFWVPSDEGGSSEDAGEGEAGEEVGSDVDMDGEGADDDDAELSGELGCLQDGQGCSSVGLPAGLQYLAGIVALTATNHTQNSTQNCVQGPWRIGCACVCHLHALLALLAAGLVTARLTPQ
jgi:hypothetical protein